MSDLRFYFDESVEAAVSEQLSRTGFDSVSAHSLDKRGDKDIDHLRRATEMERVLCTYDADFIVLASQGVEHAGILFANQEKASIGDWIREIRYLQATYLPEQIKGHLVYMKKRR